MGDSRFRAFISYSHADEAWGAWLQQALERYRVPRALAATLAADGKSIRLGPVFRDREDLPVAGSLNSAIQQALADSEFQIVLCSPASAKSRWVNEEIKLFHKLHGPGRVFALIIAGEPGASATPARESEECFPPALRFRLDADGTVSETPAETLAADAREGGDGKRYAMLKVAAGMLGVGLDDLVRRDATRRARFAWTVAGASIAGMAATGALAFYAIAKGNEATAMRGRAENLVEFMLTELRDKLEPVGRIDILEAVGERAMKYYADQDLRTLNEDALARRAKALLLLGEIDFLRNDLDAAQTAYASAVQATNEQLRRDPKNPTRIFDHAQAVFYNGETAVARGDLGPAEAWYREYLRLAQELVKIDGTNPDYQLEIAYATSNLGSVKFFDGRYEEAIDDFKGSIATRRRLFDAAPSDADIAFDYAYALSWRAFAELMRGSCEPAIDLIKQQLTVYGDQSSIQSENFRVLNAAVTAHRRLAECHLARGRTEESRAAIGEAAAIANRLLEREKENANWNVNASHIERMLSLLAKLDGDDAAAISHAEKAIEYADAACARKTCEEWMRHARALAFARRIQSGDGPGADDDAARLDAMLGELRGAESTDGASTLAAATLALERYRRRNGDLKTADALIRASLPPIERRADKIGALAKMSLAALYLDAGDADLARPIIDELRALNVLHPEFIALSTQFQAAAVD